MAPPPAPRRSRARLGAAERLTDDQLMLRCGRGHTAALTELMERHAGEWQGLTRAQIEERDPGALDARRRPPGWEDDGEVERRVMDALDAIAQDVPDGEVVAVAHAGVIYALERVLGGEWERLGNLGGRRIEMVDGTWRLGERVHLLAEETVPGQL